MPPPDDAADDACLGNGYFPSWCADVVRRQLMRAARDPQRLTPQGGTTDAYGECTAIV